MFIAVELLPSVVAYLGYYQSYFKVIMRSVYLDELTPLMLPTPIIYAALVWHIGI